VTWQQSEKQFAPLLRTQKESNWIPFVIMVHTLIIRMKSGTFRYGIKLLRTYTIT
jgi:hypothetical protein